MAAERFSRKLGGAWCDWCVVYVSHIPMSVCQSVSQFKSHILPYSVDTTHNGRVIVRDDASDEQV